jgi:uncharacterized protein YecE (DUF72 family)
MTANDRQTQLFDLPPPSIEPAAEDSELMRLAAGLPRELRFGGMSWTYPGWRGLVYDARASDEAIIRAGLGAYAKHPLLRAVEVDRTYYEPLSSAAYAGLARQVPEGFRFVVKAHEACTVFRVPLHARYGKDRGRINPLYLDASYAEDKVAAPAAEGLGDKAGVLLFQFPPQDTSRPEAFAEDLHQFLRRLPRTIRYAVELRNRELLSRTYAAALADTGAVHCHNAWTAMPDVLTQARRIPPPARIPLVIRWLLRQGDPYADAKKRAAPFDRIALPDETTLGEIGSLLSKAGRHDVPCFVLVNNNAEGCAPKSIERLARRLTEA